MSTLKKKDTLIRTISFMAFFVAINVVCSFLTTVVPLLSIILIIFLPLTSALVEVMCKDRWFPIYAFATIGLSVVVSLSSIDFTIFYIVPSIFTGYIFGLFSKRNLPPMFAIFFATIIQTILSFSFIPLIQLITGSNLIDVFAKILKISDRFWFDTAILLLFFLIALVQIILSYIVVDNELRKFGEKSEPKLDQKNIANVATISCAIISLIFVFIYLPVYLLFLGFTLYFAVFVVVFEVKDNQRVLWIIDGVCLFANILLYAALNKFIEPGKDFSLFLIFPTLIATISMVDSFLKKSKQ